MVWKAGRVASTVRKVAIASFYSLLHRGYADRSVLFKVAPPLLPVLKTDLDDYDASTRELVCLSLDLMFRALPLALSEQPVLELYPALLKRLDDSSDKVRIAVCSCFLSFLKAAPPSAFHGTTIDYTLDQLLVHLDDVDPAIQVKERRREAAKINDKVNVHAVNHILLNSQLFKNVF
jgi:dynein assembly factor 5, axonemal